jgi:mono/diheme cytochrome c family protein
MASSAGATEAAPTLRVCIDSASPTAGRDKGVADAVAKRENLALSVKSFDGGGDDDGVPARQFRKLLSGDCDLVMGYPVDATAPSLPTGLLASKPYAQTGFVLVTAPGVPASSLSDLPWGTGVAVTYGTAPNLYFADHANLQADIRTTDAETVQAVASGAVRAAMVWQPTIEALQARDPAAARLVIHPLHEPHARYDIVALYLPQGAHQAGLFGATRIAVDAPVANAAALPALYTKAQASLGFIKFLANCAQCHGAHLEGRSGPALKGPNWANAKADYTVGEVFTVVSQQMPATAPGSLTHDEYVDIMAYLLQQNGYPAGAKALDFDTAAASKAALLWHGG